MFNENEKEYSSKEQDYIEVWKTPKYEATKKTALELINSKKYGLDEGDFWILMNETKRKQMAYTGLIISHNACLKINDHLESKFDRTCVSVDKQGYGNSLVFSYCNAEQGLFEVGEVSVTNCKNGYPYAMAFKRLYDRVVLKLSKLAYGGIYSEDEAEEFKDPLIDPEIALVLAQIQEIHPTFVEDALAGKVAKNNGWTSVGDFTLEYLKSSLAYFQKQKA